MWQIDLKWRQDFRKRGFLKSWKRHFLREDCGTDMMEEGGWKTHLCHFPLPFIWVLENGDSPYRFDVLTQLSLLKIIHARSHGRYLGQPQPPYAGELYQRQQSNHGLGLCPTQNGILQFENKCAVPSLGSWHFFFQALWVEWCHHWGWGRRGKEARSSFLQAGRQTEFKVRITYKYIYT